MKSSRPVVVITFSDGIEGAHLQLLKDEKTALENTLWDLHAQELIEIYKEESMSRKELVELLPRFKHNRIILFHYAGHAGSSGIHTEGGESRAEGLAALLGKEEALQLVVLNGCSTMEQVQGLKDKGVKAIVATSSEIGDEAAKNFSSTLYKRLVTGYTLKDAFSYAIAAAKTEVKIDSNIVPMRSINLEESTPDAIPWDLYYDENHPEILDWKLPSPAAPKEHIDPSIYKTPEELEAMTYPEKKGHLLKVLDNDLNRIIPDMDVLMSADSEHREPLRLLHIQLNDYFRNKHSSAVSGDDLEAEKKRIKLSLNHMISLLESKDFAKDVPAAPIKETVQAPVDNMKQGAIWRKIPPKMQLNKASEVKIKIAVDKDQLKQERSSSDIKIRIDTIRVSNEMEVDLFEPPLGDPCFDVKFMGSKTQLVDIEEPTEWTFYVTPLKEGNCKLILHVSIIQGNGDKGLTKVIPFEEEIEVVTYKPEELGVYEKAVVLRYLPWVALTTAGPFVEKAKQKLQPKQEQKVETTPKAKSAANSTAGLGIGKVIGGVLALAALGALAWLGLRDGTPTEGNPDTGQAQEETLPVDQNDGNDTDVAPAVSPQEEPPSEQPAETPTQNNNDAVAPTLANANLNYEMTVDDNLSVPYADLVEGAYSSDYNFKIISGGSTDKLNITAGANALSLKALKAGTHTIKYEICKNAAPCSTGNININIKAKAVEVAEEDTPPPPPPASYEYGTVNGPKNTYNTVKIGDTWWTRKNLNEMGYPCYNNDASKCNQTGSFYDYYGAQDACNSLSPGTWKLPTTSDWNALKNAPDDLAELLLPKSGVLDSGTYVLLGQVGRFWSSQEGVDFEYSNSGLKQKSTTYFQNVSCRCVKK
jgi:uncharacterized protein (TIGR02145 family)